MEKLKRAFIVWISIYPAITVIMLLFGDILGQVPIVLRTFILTIILVPLMIYILIPFWTHVFNQYNRRFSLSKKGHK